MCPTISIFLMTYNRSGMLREALDAVLAQTYDDFELIVLDDASTDDTYEVVKAYTDSRLFYVRNSVNLGPVENSEHAFKRGRGKFLKVLNDDDIPHPTMLEREMGAMDAYPEAMVVGCNMRAMDAKGRITQRRMHEGREDRIFGRGEYIEAYMQDRFIIYWPTYLFRVNEDYRTIVNTPKHVGPLGDILALGRSNIFGDIVYLSEPLLDYRIHDGQETFNAEITPADIRLHEALLDMCKKHKLLSPIPSIKRSLLRHQLLTRIINGQPHTTEFNALLKVEEKYPCNYSLPIHLEGHPRFKSGKRVAIFGSFLNAYSLWRECERSGVEVVCFLDENKIRISKTFVGVPVKSLHWLSLVNDSVDAVLISSECRPVEQLKAKLRKYTNKELIHWRDLL